MSDDTDACKWNNIESSIPKPSDKCTGDCQDAYRTYRALAHKLNRVPSVEEVLYMTADTEYSVPAAHDDAVRTYGQEGLARSFYSKCKTDGCQSDELYQFLSGYQPWIGNAGQPPDEPTTPESRAQALATALGSNKDWLWADMSEITNIKGVARQKGWIKGLLPRNAAQWFGPFTPTQQCRNKVNPVYPYKYGNGTEFWILPPEEIAGYNEFCK